jgi:hypothetical protein
MFNYFVIHDTVCKIVCSRNKYFVSFLMHAACLTFFDEAKEDFCCDSMFIQSTIVRNLKYNLIPRNLKFKDIG